MAQGDKQERINILSKFYNMQGGDNKKSHRGRRLGVPWEAGTWYTAKWGGPHRLH